MKELEGKVIVVSGGTKGVGRAACEEFARAGAKIAIGGRDETEARKIIKNINTFGSKALFVKTDLEKVEDIETLFKKAYEEYGKIDGFFNYAGVTPVSPLDDCSLDTYDWVMDVNVRSCFFCCQQAIKYMRLNGTGSIVITGSPHAWGGEKDRAAYAVSKGALYTLMEHIAHNYASEKIRCNYLTLGWTPTDGEVALRKSQGENESELRKRAGSLIPMGRMNEKSDYLKALIYLMSDDSFMTTGSNFRITGGFYC